MNRLTVAVLATFVVLLLGSGLLAYVFRDHGGPTVTTATPSGSPSSGQIAAPAASEREARRGIPLLGELFGPMRPDSHRRMWRVGKQRRRESRCALRWLRFLRRCSRFVGGGVVR